VTSKDGVKSLCGRLLAGEGFWLRVACLGASWALQLVALLMALNVASHGGDAATAWWRIQCLPARRINAEREQSGLSGVLGASPEHLDRLVHPTLTGLGLLGVLDPLGIFLAMGVREPLERLARCSIVPEGPGQVVGHLDLPRLDVGLDPDPDPIPDPDAGGFLDLRAEPNLGPPAVHRDRRSEGDVVDRRLDLGPGCSVRRLDVER
jgi:hypothetical protein